MNQRPVRLLLRVIAIAIAIAGLMDPALSTSRPPPQRLIAIRMTSAPAVTVEQALTANLPGWIIEPRDGHSRVPCGPDEQCVVIADGSSDASIPGDLSRPLSLITVAADDGPNVAVRSVAVSPGHQSAGGVARIELSGTGPPAMTSKASP